MAGLLSHILSRPVMTGAIKVSLFVGTCLNAINQGSALWHASGIEWGKVLLNYAVPYLVSSYSAAKARQTLEG
ncbi:nitrate/nitrite transporter NrtS [Novosphingobium sp.]|uniref:nitrate/nitrite transporter NrtS n=1 Tax=Novosphingobium sp. TaxID=1874826 RepID=UPI0027371DE5|nr:nitrate/nitrite transporter NrtS [Novosphingobium sp.]MDP3906728.1 nitrate/nitrite transporter NrtS [Novosphingobium sp.]